MLKTYPTGMQAYTTISIRALCPVLDIPFDGRTHLCQLATYLMMTACLQIHLKQMIILHTAQQAIRQYRSLSPAALGIISIRLILLLVTHQIMHQLTFRIGRTVLYKRPIGLFDAPSLTKHGIEAFESLTRTSKDHHPTYRAVEPMYHTKEDSTRLIVFLLDISLHHFRQRHVSCLISLHNFRRRLVDYNDMIIFVKDIHFLFSV